MSERLPLEERLHRFVDELRSRGLPVSMVERLDAMHAVVGTDLAAPGALHTALSATLVKNVDHQRAFDDAFDLFFRAVPPAVSPPVDDLDAAVEEVLRSGDSALARAVAEQAFARFVDFEPGRRVAGVFYGRQAMRGLRVEELLAGGSVGKGGGSGAARGNAARLEGHVEQVIREAMVADRGPADVARVLRTPLLDDVDLTTANAAQVAEIERALPVLQRKLATTLLRRRRRARGRLDVRATMRHAMSAGGVPVRLVERPARPTKPQLFVLADMSGSVANFAGFSVSFVAALAPLFSTLRAFAFVREVVEVTDVVRRARGSREAAAAARAAITGTGLGGSTDYGRALTAFRDAVAPSLGHRSVVVVLGDARGNHAAPRTEALVDLARRAGRVYWLNPEPRPRWGTGDSLALEYAPHCTEMVTCRTVADLRRFLERLP